MAAVDDLFPKVIVMSDDGHPMIANAPLDGSEPTALDVVDDDPSPEALSLVLGQIEARASA